MSLSRSVFLLVLAALIVGWIYMAFNPSHSVEENLMMNINYFPSVTEKSIEGK